MNLRPPDFLHDVFRDMRDRRLLIPAAALLVALVAVPVLLSRSPSSVPTPPPAPAAGAIEDAVATQPAVLTDNVSVRDYRKRLNKLKAKNPFQEQFVAPATDGGGLEPEGGGGSSTAAGSGLSAEPSGTGGATSSGSTGSSSSSPTTSSSGSSGSSGSSSGSTATRIEQRYFSWKIDVKVGKAGELKERNGVGQLKMLPSNGVPVAVFLGITENGKGAVFAISGDVSAVDTDGKCAPSTGDCQYVILTKGETAKLDYDPNGNTYVLKLRKIHRIEVDEPGKVGDL